MPAGHPLLEPLGVLARRAGEVIMELYQRDPSVRYKADGSPVTAADLAAQKVIGQGLAALEPGCRLVSEEAPLPAWNKRRRWPRYWLIDPLDGTRNFIGRNGEFSVNIALVEHHCSVLGVVLGPASGQLFAAARGYGAWHQLTPAGPWRRLSTRPLARPACVLTGRSQASGPETGMLGSLLEGGYCEQALGSSLKFCLIASGQADVYLRPGFTSQWDSAASQCVLEEAGGAVLDLKGQPLRYNLSESIMNSEFIAIGDIRIDWGWKLRNIEILA